MIDPELAAMVELLPKMDLADPVAARRAFEEILVAIRIEIPGVETLDIEDRMVPGWEDDPDVSVRVYRPKGASATARVPGIVMIHGGGFVIGSVEAEHAGAALTAIGTGAVVVSVDYRLAPEHPYPAGLHDCYAALRFLHAEADALGVDPERVALTGASAGGGLSAATALFARDRGGPAVCFQLLAIPELDDRLADAVHAGLRGLAHVEPAAGRAELAGVSRAALRIRRRAGLCGAGRGPRTCRGCRRPISRPPRTTRCATRGSCTPNACCRPVSRSSCTSSPAPSTARRW